MLELIRAIASLCTLTSTGVPPLELHQAQLECQKYYVRCVDLEAAPRVEDKLKLCIMKKTVKEVIK